MNNLLYLGCAVMLLGQVWCAKAAFSRGTAFGLVVLLVPFASLVLAYKYIDEARVALGVNLVGMLLAGTAVVSNGLSHSVAVAQEKTAALHPGADTQREGLLKACRKDVAEPIVCDCIVDRMVAHYASAELDAQLTEHSASGAWGPGTEDFMRLSQTLCEGGLSATADGGAKTLAQAPRPPVEPAASASPYEWTSASYGGRAVLRQGLLSSHSCNLTCAVDGQAVWGAPVDCIATGRDFRFVSVDCERVVVVHNVKVDGTNWKNIAAATVYKRSKKAYDVGAMTVVKDPRRVMTSATWLQGVLGGTGEPPRYSKDGKTVEIDCVDGKHSQIPLVVADEPAAPEPEEKAPPPAPKKKKRKH